MKIFRFWKSTCWFALILFLTFLPGSAGKRIKLFVHADKIIHFLLFLIFSLLLIIDAGKSYQEPPVRKNILPIVIIAGLFTGLFTESVQYFLIADRTCSAGDFIADMTGIIIGLVVYKLIGYRFKS